MTGLINTAVMEWWRRMWKRIVHRECDKCASRLIELGQDNGTAQKHINDAKDSLYKALSALEK